MTRLSSLSLFAVLLTACNSATGTPNEKQPAAVIDEPVGSEEATLGTELEPTSAPAKETVEQEETATEATTSLAVLDGVEYSVINEDTVPGIKRSLDIRLEKRVSEDVLEALALRLKAEDSGAYERTFIMYYLPEMEVGAGAWATSHFDPELDIEILGATAEELEAISSEEVESASRDVIGRWLDDRAFINQQILIFREAGTTYIEFSYDDGSSRITEYIETSVPGGIRFEDKAGSDSGDHYLLTPAGALEIRDDEGLIATATRVD